MTDGALRQAPVDLEHVREIELRLLLEAIYLRYHYDFRNYAIASLKRRMRSAMQRLQCASIGQLQERILHHPTLFAALMDYLTVQVSDMFRDPAYFRALREQVVPILRTYPSVRIWVAGCSTGEEAYSLAILMREEGLLERIQIYATDINASALRTADAGIYDVERMRAFTENHRASGGRGSLSEHYTAAYGKARLDPRLKRHIVFSDHSLATDSVFSEVHLISCRNVLIYFDRTLKDRAIGLFRDALCRNGFVGLGAKESLQFTAAEHAFQEFARGERVYRKIG